MAGQIKYFTKENFARQGIFNEFHSECKINNLHWKRGDTYRHQEIKAVLNLCKKFNQREFDTIIVRSEADLTIWIEDKSQTRNLLDDSSDRTQTNSAAPEAAQQQLPTKTVTRRYRGQTYEETDSTAPEAAQQQLPTKTVTRRYRGQTYEETVIDWAAVQQANVAKPRRKYRGQYVD